jgi:hypothetical protein
MQSGKNDECVLDVLAYLAEQFEATDMKDTVIARPNPKRAADIVNGFNEDELEQWKAGVRNGVENNDWTDLIMHRTCVSDCRMVGSRSIVTAAKRQKPKMLNVTPTHDLSHQQEKGTAITKLSLFIDRLTGSLSH